MRLTLSPASQKSQRWSVSLSMRSGECHIVFEYGRLDDTKILLQGGVAGAKSILCVLR